MPTTLRTDGLYCAYLRKSRKDVELEAMGGGDTLARHEHALRELAARYGIAISQTYREVVSGDTIADRPEVRRLLDAVNNGAWDGVLVMDVDRLGRGDSIDQGVIMQSFAYSNTLIITPDKVYDPQVDADEESVEFKLFFSRFEYRMIKKRLQRGKLASAMDGCYMGSRPVYGYERIKMKGRKGWTLKIVPEKASIVRAVFEWYAYGMDGRRVGSGAIALRLADMGVKTENGKLFSPAGVRQILQNPIYIGKTQYNQRVTVNRIVDGKRVKTREKNDDVILVDGHHDPIIDRELWDRVQAIFATHAKPPAKQGTTIASPFAGLLRCSVCGKTLQFCKTANARSDSAVVKCRTQRCPTCSSYVHTVEDAVLHMLRDWVAEFEAEPLDLPVATNAEIEAAGIALASLREQRETLTTQLNRLCDLLEQGVYTVTFFQERQALLSAQLAEIDESIARANALPKPDPRRKIIPRLRTVLEAYPLATTGEEKNRLLRSVIDHIDYSKTQKYHKRNDLAADLSLTIHPKLPSED